MGHHHFLREIAKVAIGLFIADIVLPSSIIAVAYLSYVNFHFAFRASR